MYADSVTVSTARVPRSSSDSQTPESLPRRACAAAARALPSSETDRCPSPPGAPVPVRAPDPLHTIAIASAHHWSHLLAHVEPSRRDPSDGHRRARRRCLRGCSLVRLPSVAKSNGRIRFALDGIRVRHLGELAERCENIDCSAQALLSNVRSLARTSKTERRLERAPAAECCPLKSSW